MEHFGTSKTLRAVVGESSTICNAKNLGKEGIVKGGRASSYISLSTAVLAATYLLIGVMGTGSGEVSWYDGVSPVAL